MGVAGLFPGVIAVPHVGEKVVVPGIRGHLRVAGQGQGAGLIRRRHPVGAAGFLVPPWGGAQLRALAVGGQPIGERGAVGRQGGVRFLLGPHGDPSNQGHRQHRRHRPRPAGVRAFSSGLGDPFLYVFGGMDALVCLFVSLHSSTS